MSKLLRHDALKENLQISSDGYILVEELLQHRFLKDKCSIEDIKRIVNKNDKQRFNLIVNSSGKLIIKANQGHSIQVSE